MGEQLLQEASFLQGVYDDVGWLRTELRRMQSFLKDALHRQRAGDNRVKNWVRDVGDAAHHAEDIMDTFMLRIERKRGRVQEFIRRYSCIPVEFLNLHWIGKEILQVKSKVQSMRESREAYGIVNLGQSNFGSADEGLQARRQLSPRLHGEALVVGFHDQRRLIVNRLLDCNVKRRSVTSIVGMGGLGKTTLAVRIYNSEEIKPRFSSRASVTVSQDFWVRDLLKSTIKQMLKAVLKEKEFEDLEKLELNDLKLKLFDFLQHERCLIIFDDIWEPAVWGQLEDAFPDTDNYSRVLVTTLSMADARSADPRSTSYELPFLDADRSWELFLRVVFTSGRGSIPSCPEELEAAGRGLVKRCGGLPLAVVVLGGLISTVDQNVNAWREVAENRDWEFNGQGQECLQILALSYNHLPHHHLKSCFLYLGMFPEDHQIKVSELIRLWVAEGFISERENRTMEETAKIYLDELLHRCMVQAVGTNVSTKWVKSVHIHDLLRDWCIAEAKQDGFFRIYINRQDAANALHDYALSRRLVLLGDISTGHFRSPTHKARTVMCLRLDDDNRRLLKSFVHSFKLLRVICIHSPEIQQSSLPEEISKLVHLRNITLRSNSFDCLPSSVGKLPNLETLDVRGTKIYQLPVTLYKVETLRHACTASPLTVSSSGIGRLRNLQTLKSVRAGSWIGSNLEKLSSLRTLYVYDMSATHVSSFSDAFPKLDNLVSLFLHTNEEISAGLALASTSQSYQHRLSKLTLHGPWQAIHRMPETLVKLKLVCCVLEKTAIATLERLPSLTTLILNGCIISEEMVFSAGGFPSLQNLQARNVSCLYGWRIESGAMPKTTYVGLRFQDIGMFLPDGIENMASLQKLVITENYLTLVSGKFPLRGDIRRKIQHIPYVEINEVRVTGSNMEMILNTLSLAQE